MSDVPLPSGDRCTATALHSLMPAAHLHLSLARDSFLLLPTRDHTRPSPTEALTIDAPSFLISAGSSFLLDLTSTNAGDF
jgi:hypothetical protein